MNNRSVLVVCIHNSARSQMAEAWCNHLFEGQISADSAGLEPGTLNPLVVRAMKETGIDISGQSTTSVFDLLSQGRCYAYVVTVCDQAAAERCPVFPHVTGRINWSFRDPSALAGTDEEKLAQVRLIRDEIRAAVEAWGAEVLTSG